MSSNLRILIAEDNAVNQKVLVAFLRRLGYEADVVEDGHGVVDAVTTASYDIVLMDIRMPGLDGVGATVQLRALGGEIQQPYVMAITASAMASDYRRFEAAGIDTVLTKPLTLNQLEAALAAVRAA